MTCCFDSLPADSCSCVTPEGQAGVEQGHWFCLRTPWVSDQVAVGGLLEHNMPTLSPISQQLLLCQIAPLLKHNRGMMHDCCSADTVFGVCTPRGGSVSNSSSRLQDRASHLQQQSSKLHGNSCISVTKLSHNRHFPKQNR
jgi:hypothetical protein